MHSYREQKSIGERIQELIDDEVGNRRMKTILRKEFSGSVSGKTIKSLRRR